MRQKKLLPIWYWVSCYQPTELCPGHNVPVHLHGVKSFSDPSPLEEHSRCGMHSPTYERVKGRHSHQYQDTYLPYGRKSIRIIGQIGCDDLSMDFKVMTGFNCPIPDTLGILRLIMACATTSGTWIHIIVELCMKTIE